MQDCKGSGHIHYRPVADSDESSSGDTQDAVSATIYTSDDVFVYVQIK